MRILLSNKWRMIQLFPPSPLRASHTAIICQQVIPTNNRQRWHFTLAGILADPLARGSKFNRTIATIQNSPFPLTGRNYYFISQWKKKQNQKHNIVSLKVTRQWMWGGSTLMKTQIPMNMFFPPIFLSQYTLLKTEL